MNLNKLVHETRGKCWHEWLDNSTATCMHCGECLLFAPTSADYIPATRNPDYENSMNACMELWEEVRMGALRRSSGGHRAFYSYPDDHAYAGALEAGPEATTPQLAIIAAYLKSKGVELGEDND